MAVKLKKTGEESIPRLGKVEEDIHLELNISNWKELGSLLNALRFNPARCGYIALKLKNKGGS